MCVKDNDSKIIKCGKHCFGFFKVIYETSYLEDELFSHNFEKCVMRNLLQFCSDLIVEESK